MNHPTEHIQPGVYRNDTFGDIHLENHNNGQAIHILPIGSSIQTSSDIHASKNVSPIHGENQVPVNEHKKYMRGEKLKITQDYKGIKSERKRRAGYIAGSIIIVLCIIFGLLFAFSSFSGPKEIPKRSDGTQTNTTTETLHLPADENKPIIEDNADYVPQVRDGQMTFYNLEYLSGYNDTTNPLFRNLARSIKLEMDGFLKRENVEVGGISVRVMELRPGSVKVSFRVTWSYDNNNDSDIDWVKASILTYLNKTNGHFMNFGVKSESVKIYMLKDKCIISDMGCIHGCRFSYEDADFICKNSDEVFRSSHGTHRHNHLDDKHSSHGSPYLHKQYEHNSERDFEDQTSSGGHVVNSTKNRDGA